MEKDQNQDQKLLTIKRGQKILIEFLKRKIIKMTDGVRVLIKTKSDSGEKIEEYGYITRRLNAHLYEVYGETSNILFNLSPIEFKEISKINILDTQ